MTMSKGIYKMAKRSELAYSKRPEYLAWMNAIGRRCHLSIQGRVDPNTPYMFEHSDWLKPFVAGFYAKKYQKRDLSRDEVFAELEALLSIERIA